jgi:hypothetical protein
MFDTLYLQAEDAISVGTGTGNNESLIRTRTQNQEQIQADLPVEGFDEFGLRENYSGDGYFDPNGGAEDKLEFAIPDSVLAGSYQVTVRGAASSMRSIALRVNEGTPTGPENFETDSTWGWKTETFSISIPEGSGRTLTILQTTASGPNIDAIAIHEEGAAVNFAPPAFTVFSLEAVENGVDVGAVMAVDPEVNPREGQTLTYSITGGADQAAFRITEAGVLTFVTAPDFENPTSMAGGNAYEVEVSVTDGFETVSETITVNVVNDISDDPGVIFLPVTIQGEDATVTDTVGTSGGALTVALRDGDVDAFNNVLGGNRTGQFGEDLGFLDFGQNPGDEGAFDITVPFAGTYSFTVRYANGSGPRPLDVAVDGAVVGQIDGVGFGDWNDFGEKTVDLQLSAGANTVSLIIPQDGNNGPNVDQVTVDLVELNTSALTVTPLDPQPAENVDGAAIATVVLNAVGATYAPADFVLTDPSGRFELVETGAPNTFTLKLKSGEALDFEATEQPTVTVAFGSLSQDVTPAPLEDAAPVVADGVANTEEDASVDIDLSALITDDADALASLSLDVVSTDGSVTVSPDNATATFTPDDDFNGEATVSITATDSNGAVSATGTVTVTVNSVNDPPSLIGGPIAQTIANAGGVIDLSGLIATDVDGSAPTLAVRLANGDPAPAGVEIDENGDLVIPGGLEAGDLALEIFATDGQLVSETVTVTVTVEPSIDPGVVVFDIAAIEPYSSQDQPDNGGAGVSVGADGGSLTLDGNLWKRMPFSYALTETSRLSVTIDVSQTSEIVAIGVDSDLDPFNDNTVLFQLAGTQNWGGAQDLRGTGIGDGASQTFVIDLSGVGASQTTYLNFIADDDNAGDGLGGVTFSNVAFSEGVIQNAAPRVVGGGIADVTVAEGSDVEIDLAFIDEDGDPLTFGFTVRDAVGSDVTGVSGLTLDGHVISGALAQGLPAGVYTIETTADDGVNPVVTDSFSLTVEAVNEAPEADGDAAFEPIFGQVGQPIDSVDIGLFVGAFSDPDGDLLSYSVENLPAGLSFDADEGVISGTPTEAGQGTFTLVATDPDGLRAELQIALILDAPAIGDTIVIEAEDFTGLAAATEFYATGQSGASGNQLIRVGSSGDQGLVTTDLSQNGLTEGFYRVSMTRYDETDGSAVYSLTIGDTVLATNAAFDGTPDQETADDTFDNANARGNAGQSGNIKTIVFDTPVFVTAGTILSLSGAANGELLRTDKFTFTRVEEPNEAPSEVALEGATVAENADDIDVGTLSASDPDGDDEAIIFSVDAASPFEVVGETLRLKAGRALDFETDGASVDVVVTATDAGGASTETALTITVADINEAPSAPVLTQATAVPENVSEVAIGTLSADDDSLGLTFTVTDPRFTVIDDQLALAPGASLNFEDGGSVVIDVTVDDGENATTGQIAIEVADANDAPVLPTSAALADVVLDANTGAQIDLAALGAIDEDASDTVTYAISGEAAVAAGFVVEADGVTLTVPASAPAGAYEVTVFATDGRADSESVSFTVTVGEPAPFAPFAVQAEDGVITLSQALDPDSTQVRDPDNLESNPNLVTGLRPAFSGSGYVDFGNDAGDTLILSVNVPTTGSYDLNIRYASNTARPLDLSINGAAVGSLPFASTDPDAGGPEEGFDNWLFQTVTVTLTAGDNAVALAIPAGATTGPNIDRIEITAAGSGPIPVDESADADELPLTLSGETGELTPAQAASITFNVSGDDPDIVTYEISFDGGATRTDVTGLVDANGDFSIDGSALAAGPQTATIIVTDGAGNEAQSALSFSIADDAGGNVDPITVQAEEAVLTDVGAPGSGPEGRAVTQVISPDDLDAFGNYRAGAVGGSYVDFGEDVGDNIAFSINAPVAGAYTTTIRYANGSANDRPLEILVNGVSEGNVSFAPTDNGVGVDAGWEDWTDLEVELQLTAGENVVTLQIPAGASTGPNIDQITFTLKEDDGPDVTEPGARETIRINFQDGVTPKAEGYLIANFDGYQARANGETYGFVTEASVYDADTTSNTPIDGSRYPAVAINERSGTGENGGIDDGVDFDSFDPRLTGYAHTDLGSYPGAQDDPNERVAFELAVENGWYEVTVAVGDTGGPNDSDNKLEIEGQLVSDFVPTEDYKTQLVTAQIEVTDGNLTLAAPNGTITEFQYLDVRALPDLTPDDDAPATADYSTVVSPVAASGVGETFSETPLVQTSGPVVGIDPTAAFTMGLDLADGRSGVLLESLNSGAIKLVKALTGEEVAITVNTSGGFDTLTISPLQPLKEFTAYNLIIDGLLDRGAVDDLDAPSREFLKSTFTFTTKEQPEIVDREVAFTDTLEYRSNPSLGEVYTSIEISPDGTKLYTSSLAGALTRWDIDPIDGSIDTSSQEVFFPSELNQAGGRRGIVGLVFDPEDPNTIWITDNYPVPLSGRDNGVPDFSGSVAKVTLGANGSLADATYETYITGLPRSNGDHVTNSLEFRNIGTAEAPEYKLYLIQGSNSAMGAPDGAWGLRPERLLNAAVMEIDHKRTDVPPGGFDVTTEPLPADGLNRRFADTDNNLKNGGIPITSGEFNGNFLHFDANGVATVRTGADAGSDLVRQYYDPFAEDAVLSIFATGQRNAYDLVWHSNGFLYAPTNGSAAGGNTPDNPATTVDESATNVERQDDYLFIIEEGSYSGHPNALRNEYVLNGGNPTAAQDPNQVNKYPVGIQPESNYDPARAYSLGPNRSPNGAIEYTADVFGANLKGALIFAEYSNDNNLRAILLDENGLPIPDKDFALQRPDGTDIQSSDPLDVIQDAKGRLYVLTLERDSGTSNIIRLDPAPGGVVSDTTADQGGDLAIVVTDATDPAAVVYELAGVDADITTRTVTFTDGTNTVTAEPTGNGTFTIDLSGLVGAVAVSLTVVDEVGNDKTVSASPFVTGEPGASTFIDATDFSVLSTLTGAQATVIRNINDPSTHETTGANDANGDGLNDGYDGLAYLDPNGGAEDKAQFTFDAPAAGVYSFSFRMAATGDRAITFIVGDQSETVTVGTTTFTNWTNFDVVFTLAEGVNTIVISQPGNSGPNIDSVTVTSLAIFDDTADQFGDLDLTAGDLSDKAQAQFSVSGADSDLVSATVIFTDGANTVTETLANDGDFNGAFTVDLSGLSGEVTATLTVNDGTNTATETAVFDIDDDVVPNDGTEEVGGQTFVIYEAENAELDGPVIVTEDRTQSGDFVDFDGTVDQTVTWTVSVAQDGDYAVDILYALSTTKDARPMALSVDGVEIATLPFAPNSNAAETTWLPQTTQLTLSAGVHAISVTAPNGNGPNLDYLRISQAPLTEPLDLSADEGDPLTLTVLDQTDAAAVVFQVSGDDDDVATYEVSFNNGAPIVVTLDESGQFTADTGIVFGPVNATLTVTDDAGNTAGANIDFAVSPNGNPNADIAIQSLDPGFFDDRLHFSFVNNSDGRLSKETAQAEITNTGAEALEIIDFTISEFYSVVDPAALSGASIAAGDSLIVTVEFDGSTGGANGFPSRSSNVNGVYEGALTLVTNDAEDPFTTVDLAAFWQPAQEGGNEPNVNEVWQVLGFGNRIAGLPFAGGGENSILDFDDLYLPAPGQEGIEILSPYWRMADGATEITATIIAAYNASGSAGLGIHAPGDKGNDKGIAAWSPSAQSQTVFPLKGDGDFATLTFDDGFIPDGWTGNDVFGIEMAGLSTDPTLNTSGNGTPSQNALNANYGQGNYTVTGTGANAVVTDAAGNVVEDGYTVRMFQALDANGVVIPNVYLGMMDYTGINYDYNDNMFIFEGITPVFTGGQLSISGLDDAAADDRLVFTNIEQPNNNGKGLGLTQTFRNEATFTITNDGIGELDITGLTIDDPAFEIVSSVPATLAAGASLDVTVSFVGTDGVDDNQAVLHEGALTIETADGARTIQLAGLAQFQSEAGEEPTVAQIVQAFGYSTDVAQGALNGGGDVETVGDEVLMPYLERLDGSKPIEIINIAAFLQQGDISRLNLHEVDSAALTELFAGDEQQGQTVLPTGLVAGDGDTGSVARVALDRDAPFGLKVTVDGRPGFAAWTDPEINKLDDTLGVADEGHYFRFFQAKDATGAVIEGTFIAIQDYPAGGNFDYNDAMFVITNVQPHVLTGADDADADGVNDALAADADGDGIVNFFDIDFTPPTAQTPFGGAAPVLNDTLTVGAVSYDEGGQGVAYNDDPGLDGGSNGGRTGSDVEILGGAIAYVNQGEWVEYTIDVAEAGTYDLSVNAKAPTPGATVSVTLANGVPLTTITLPDANAPGDNGFGGTAFGDTPAQQVSLAAGTQTLRFTFDGTAATNGYVLDFASFTLEKAEPTNTAPTTTGITGAPESVEGTAYSFDISGFFSDPDAGDTLTFTAAGLPAGLSISSTGVISGTVEGIDADLLQAVTVTASDGEASVSSTFDLAIAAETDPGDGQSPFGGTAPTLGESLTVVAAAYDEGGQGVAYNDDPGLSGGTNGGRPGSDVEVTPLGDIGWIANGEWLEYTIDVAEAGDYDLDLVMAFGSGGTRSVTVSVFRPGEDSAYVSTDPIANPGTGGWTNFQTRSATAPLNLEAGEQVVRLTFNGGSQDIRSFTFTAAPEPNQAPTTTGITGAPEGVEGTAYSFDVSGFFSDPDAGDTLTFTAAGLPAGLSISSTGVISGTVEGIDGDLLQAVTVTASDGEASVSSTFDLAIAAESGPGDGQSPFNGVAPTLGASLTVAAGAYDDGGQGVAYNDAPGIQGGGNGGRVGSDVEIIGGDIAYVSPGEWVEYTIDVAEAGAYDLSLIAKAPTSGATVTVSLDGAAELGVITLPDANAPGDNGFGGTDFGVTPPTEIALEAGLQTLRFTFGGTVANNGYVLDLRSFTLDKVEVVDPNQPPVTVGAIDDLAVAEGGVLSLDVSGAFEDLDGDALTYSVSGLGGLSVSPEGLLSGTAPQVDADTTSTISVTASDGEFEAVQTFDLTVQNVPDVAAPSVIGESGTVTFTQTDSSTWFSVAFSQTLENAVVAIGPVSFNGGDPGAMRVRNVTDEGFEYQLDEWNYLDGGHVAETVSWIAIESGSHTVNGQTIVAGIGMASETPGAIGFGQEFAAAPVVIAQVASTNDPDAVAERIFDVTTSAFSVIIDDEEANTSSHGLEDLHWIALEVGGSVESGLLTGSTGNSVTNNSSVIDFGGDFGPDGFVFLADMQTRDGGDPAIVRLAGLDQTSATVFIEEEKSLDVEVSHTTEVVGYTLLAQGLLFDDPVVS